MKYRTKLNNEQVQFIVSLYTKQKQKGDVNKKFIAKKMKENYPSVWINKEAWRWRVRRICNQVDAQDHRGETLNNFADLEWMYPWIMDRVRIKKKLDDDTDVSALVINPKYEEQLESLRDRVIDSMEWHEPKYPTIEREKIEDWHLLVIDPADIHLWKLASEFSSWDTYNNNIAVQRCLEWVKGIIQKSHWFNIEHILFIWGNDILHIDNPKRTTTSGTPQDTDGMRHDNFMLAKQLYVDILEMLMSVADVTFLYCPSNHDWTNGFFLCQAVEARFRNCEHIEFMSNLQHRKYYKYWTNLIGLSHGDWAKEKDLPMLMSTEAKEYRSDCDNRYWYLHHIHHKVGKDYIGVTVEYIRSQSGTDRRHADNWYVWVPKAVEWFIHHPTQWQVARITHLF